MAHSSDVEMSCEIGMTTGMLVIHDLEFWVESDALSSVLCTSQSHYPLSLFLIGFVNKKR